MSAAPAPLHGRRLLLVEDEYFIAEDLERVFREFGAEVIGPVGNLDEALQLAKGEARIDGAVLDIKLHGDLVYPVADALRERGVPIVFATGYEDASIPSRYTGVPRFYKPVNVAKVVQMLLR